MTIIEEEALFALLMESLNRHSLITIAVNHVTNVQNIYYAPSEQQQEKESVTDREKFFQTIKSCQEYFWGKSAYAVVFCIARDYYH
ncbi:MAG: hypothetical protein IJV17_05670 [Prevotella sp.]|nr:hypothetical protein [Prevotella sp.]